MQEYTLVMFELEDWEQDIEYIQAENDDDAIRQANMYVDGHRIYLFKGRIEPIYC